MSISPTEVVDWTFKLLQAATFWLVARHVWKWGHWTGSVEEKIKTADNIAKDASKSALNAHKRIDRHLETVKGGG